MPDIHTTVKAIPMIYAYTTPEIARHDGWIKIGYTEKDVEERVKEQTRTADVRYNIEWRGTAIFDDGSGETFRDEPLHAYLVKKGVEKMNEGKKNEWFRISPLDSENIYREFKKNRGILETLDAIPYTLRKEQEDAVECTMDYFHLHDKSEFLWNAKPRFGKTLSVYNLCLRMGLKKILIVTNRPAIANSWYDDWEKFLGDKSGLTFISDTGALKKRLSLRSPEDYKHNPVGNGFIEFISLQNLKGSLYFGGSYDKLKHVRDTEWDLLVIDEAHEGVDTYKTDVAFDQIKRKWSLHLSGTPFKALADEKFPKNAIYNWTYADEQKAKNQWDSSLEGENPYETLPRLTLFSYKMSDIVREEIEAGIQIDDKTEKYAFDLNEFFSVGSDKRFKHEEAVDKFLNALTTNKKFPFSTPELRDELRHTIWLLDRVDSAKALYGKLSHHPIFSDYEIVLAAGDGKTDDEQTAVNSYERTKKAIETRDRTITLSVGQLTTGITVPEWSAILMLSNIRSPSLYMQAAFRVQNPCMYKGSQYKGFQRKYNAYVFDFNPARTLNIYEQFANDLSSDTTMGKGDIDSRKKHIKELLNFFPVVAEDDNGEMIELDAEKVLSIPRKIRSVEVVCHGFKSDFLFQNISNIFAAPAVVKLIQKLAPSKDEFVAPANGEFDLDENGEVSIPREKVIGISTELFGEKIYALDKEEISTKIDDFMEQTKNNDDKVMIDNLMEICKEHTQSILDVSNEKLGKKLTAKAKRELPKKLNSKAEIALKKDVGSYRIEKNMLEAEMKDALNASQSDRERNEIRREFEEKLTKTDEAFKKTISTTLDNCFEESVQDVVERVMTDEQNQKKSAIEEQVRDHLRGFSITIPSFIMAYGNEGDISLSNFDKLIPDDVFKEVTSISLEDFRFLRDGGKFLDEETGEFRHFDGHLFDEVVFNDSVKEFLRLKKQYANYFDETSTVDIFDYIPKQKTNQIFTPKSVVKEMVDMLEKENPGCFDNDAYRFADIHIKSGLYLSEIVKRLYKSERMKKLHPDERERLNHIFADQIFGLAPTEIIYRIARSFLFGFTDEIEIEKDNIRMLDATPYAKEGTLEAKLIELFGERLRRRYYRMSVLPTQ